MEHLAIENLDKHSDERRVRDAIGESAKQLREKHGLHPMEAYIIVHKRANDRTGGKLGDMER